MEQGVRRKILFRGQTRRKGEKVRVGDGKPIDSNWVYGGIFPNNDSGDFAIIYQQEPEIKKFPVYADTVCQYVGFKDIKKIKIFENDILKRFLSIEEKEIIGVVKWRDIGMTGFYLEVREEDKIHCYPIGRGTFDDDESDICDDLIIGNIFDNPELLQGGDIH